ncbi:acyl-CoA thioesterase [Thalassomonas sp. M1454]|uniref:acyl-CoA thioesterase n=1 Tax=Thalassomonas sp. M1454 TaxID=2594477 RepID=UPI0011807B91|nr:thioesterase family protein [Thalassomonas sp. M1454]TRX52479.1 acyl-CoA thioesterase [Thalassomonas sp. M1454]
MFSEKITPRFSDTDALGHINNTMIPVWFEGARNPIFKIFMPTLNLQKWPVILAKMDVEFHAQMYFDHDIEVKSYIKKVGNSSFVVYQELWQQQKLCASGNAVMVNFCYQSQKAKPISDNIRKQLELHLFV